MKKNSLFTITFCYATLLSSPLMATHEERDQSNPELLAPIDLEAIQQAIPQWVSQKAYKSALITGAVTTGLSATYFYFNPDMQTLKYASIASVGTLITASIAHWLRKSLLFAPYEGLSPDSTADVHNLMLRDYHHLLPNRSLHTLPFEDYNNAQSRLAIYRCVVKPKEDASINHIIVKYQELANNHLRALQIRNQALCSPEILNRLIEKYDFFAPIASKIQEDNAFISTLRKKITDWCEHVKQSPEYKIQWGQRSEVLNERVPLQILHYEITKLHENDMSQSDQKISELHQKTIQVLSSQYMQMLDAHVEKTKEYNDMTNFLDDDMKAFIQEHKEFTSAITLPDFRMELPKSIGKEEE